MLHNLKDLEGLTINAIDGDIGLTKDFYFDDNRWTIRYFVVETGSWFSSKKVLLSPISIDRLNFKEETLIANITREQVRHSPDIDTHKPVSRQFEVHYFGYYGYPFYWGGSDLWGSYSNPFMIVPGNGTKVPDTFADDDATRYRDQDHHLRSSDEVIGYHMEARDGEIGHLQGMLIDADTLAIRYLIINTSNWWLGHLVLIAPQWITEVSWVNEKIYVDMTQEQVKDAPPYDPDVPFTRDREKGIHHHYGRKGYWEDGLINRSV
jgi:hypothetical protein